MSVFQDKGTYLLSHQTRHNEILSATPRGLALGVFLRGWATASPFRPPQKGEASRRAMLGATVATWVCAVGAAALGRPPFSARYPMDAWDRGRFLVPPDPAQLNPESASRGPHPPQAVPLPRARGRLCDTPRACPRGVLGIKLLIDACFSIIMTSNMGRIGCF